MRFRYRDLWTRPWGHLLRRVWDEMVLDDCFGASAQLAFYFLLAFFPFVIFLAAFATLVAAMPLSELENATLHLLAQVMPPQALELVRNNVTEVLAVLSGSNLRLLGLSMAVTLWTASGGMRAVMVTLNRAYSVREGRTLWWRYVLSLLLTFALCLAALVAVPLLSLSSTFGSRIEDIAGPGFASAWGIASRIGAVMALIIAIELVYHIAPNARRPWHWITPGSIVAVLLWLGATWLFSHYVSRFGRYEALYAGLGAPIVLLLWFYITGLAILVGGEMNAEIERQSGIMPAMTVPASPTADEAGHDKSLRERPARPHGD